VRLKLSLLKTACYENVEVGISSALYTLNYLTKEYQMQTVKSTIVAVVVAMSFSSVVFAGSPETIELPASMGKVTFHHKQHQERLNDCTKCHATKDGGKIEGFGKDVAHKTCKACHTEMGKGPTSCKECHIK
jgi:hypothetical protein